MNQPILQPSASQATDGDHGRVARSGEALPRRWTLHGLNNGLIFGATVRGVRRLPRSVSYAIGHVGSWIAWRLMPGTNAAIADNLRPLFPGESETALERRALLTYRSYTRDTIDFLRALRAPASEARRMFELNPEDYRIFRTLLDEGRGLILVAGHYANWEIGAVLMRRVLDLPLTVVAMAESSPEVNRIRRQMRDRLGVETLEVRQSLETGLQIRRTLGENRAVALLMDRHLGKDRVRVSFLGREAWFLRTPALLGYLTGAPLLPCFMERLGPGRYRASVGDPIRVATDRPRDEALRDAAQRFADALSARVTAYPEFWYHFYPYWHAQREGYAGLV